MKALLTEMHGRPVFILAEPVTKGPGLVVVGLMDGQRSEAYAQIQGQSRMDAGGMVFDAQAVAWRKQTAALAWKLLLPMARKQARTAAGQSRPPGL